MQETASARAAVDGRRCAPGRPRLAWRNTMTDDVDQPTADTAARPDERRDGRHGPPAATGRYETLDTGPDTVLVYDSENAAAWIQADVALSPAAVR
jgi:hypothetical protein